MGQEHEFNVRYVRGKGVQITALSLNRDRPFWASVGMMVGITAANILHRWTKAGLDNSMILIAMIVGYQTQHLWEMHRRYKAMLAELGVSEKEMLAMVDRVIKESEQKLEEIKREATNQDRN